MSASVARPFDEVSLTGFMAKEPAPIGFAFYPLMPRAAVTLLGGHGGSGKSILALSFMAHGACGISFAGFRPECELRCLYVTFEDEGACVIDRLRAIAVAHDLNGDMIERNLRILDATRTGVSLAAPEQERGKGTVRPTHLMTELREAACGVDLIFIDTASDAFDGDENARREVRAFIGMLRDIARECGGAFVLLAHIDKVAARAGAHGQTYSGSTQWHNSVRSRLALVEGEPGFVCLRHEKANYCATAEPVCFRRGEHGVLLPAGDIASVAHAADDEAVLGLVAAAIALNEQVPVATSGPRTTAKVLARIPGASCFTATKAGRKRLDEALARLHSAGRIEQFDDEDQHRNARRSWRLANAVLSAASGGMPMAALVPPHPLPDKRTHPLADACVRQLSSISESIRTNASTHAERVDGEDSTTSAAGAAS